MSDPSTTPAVPSLTVTLTHSMAQKLASMAAAALLAGGLIPNAAVDQTTSLIAGVILLAGSIAWTYVRDKIQTDRANALKAAAK